MNEAERDANAMQTRMDELKRKFAARMGVDLGQMREALARLGTGQPDDKGGALAQIHHLAHRACGTCGTLGLLALSDAAADLERRIEACPKDEMPGSAACVQIAAGIDKIAAQVELI